MTLKYFSGVCIDGPRAGSTLTHSAPYYRCPILQENPTTFPIIEEAELLKPVLVFEYEYYLGFKYGNDVWSFWVDVNLDKEQRPRAIFQKLIAAYQRSPK